MNRLREWGVALREDAYFAYKSLARVPTYTATVVLTLALAIGGVTAVFSVLYAIVLRPLPFPDSHRLVEVNDHFRRVGLENIPLSPNEYLDVRRQNHSFLEVAAYTSGSVNLTGKGEAVRIPAGYVTADFFRMLRVSPVLGRDFAPGEDEFGAPRVTIISSAFHRRMFDGAPDVIGQSVELDGEPHTIIGVAPLVLEQEPRVAGFKGEENETREVWVPLQFKPQQLDPVARGGRYISVMARLREGATIASADADMRRLGESFFDLHPAAYKRESGWKMSVRGLKEATATHSAFTLVLLLGAVMLVLLAACANVVSLTLARLAARKREIAVRVALGATAGRIAVQFLVESLVLAVGGGLLGVVIGRAGMDGLLAAASETSIVRHLEVSLQWPVLAFVLIVSVVTGLLAGAAPAFHAARLLPTVGLREGGRSTSASAMRLRSALVVAQVAVALVLLVGTGMLLRSIMMFTATSPGFEAKDVYVGSVALSEPRYAEPEAQRRFARAALEHVQEIAGIESAALTSILPLGGWSDWNFQIEGEAQPPVRPGAQIRAVSADYFSTLKMRIVAGRSLGPSDVEGAPGAAVVNDYLVQKHLEGREPIGLRISFPVSPGSTQRRTFTIVGVVESAREMGIDEPMQPFVYGAFDQWPNNELGFVVRAPALGAQVFPALQKAVAAADATQPIHDLVPLQQMVDQSLGSRRFMLLLLGIFAALGLALAVLGIYGITSYSVVQRTQEIAVRMAMGADDIAIVRLVLVQALRLVGIGLFFGSILAAFLGRFLATSIYGLSPWDPEAVAIIASTFLMTAFLAGWVPARRAAALPLAHALRSE